MLDLINNCKVKGKIFIVINVLERENQNWIILKFYYFYLSSSDFFFAFSYLYM